MTENLNKSSTYMRVGGALSCAAVTMHVRHTPRPMPKAIGYAQSAVPLDNFAVAMSTNLFSYITSDQTVVFLLLKRRKRRYAMTVGIRSFLDLEE